MAVRICEHCGESNKEHHRLCMACGHSLRDVPLVGTPDSEKYEALDRNARERRLCSNCSEELEEGALKCKYCGAPVVKASSPTYIPMAEDTTLLWPKVLVVAATVIIPLVGLIVGGIRAFSQDKDEQLTGGVLVAVGLVMLGIHYFLKSMFAY